MRIGSLIVQNILSQVAAKQMVGVYLSVWVRAGLLPHIRGVQATSVGTGVMGYLGNKGAARIETHTRKPNHPDG